MRDLVLETERLRLRPLTTADAPLLFELDGDPEVMRFISKGAPTPRERIEAEVLPRRLRVRETDVRLGFWVAYEKEAFAGWFCLKPDRIDPRVELGYRLRRTAWGRGLATEGGRRLVRYAFAEAALDRLTAHALAANRASQRVLAKCGFRSERAFTYPAEWLPGWTPTERAAVRYGLRGDQMLSSNF